MDVEQTPTHGELAKLMLSCKPTFIRTSRLILGLYTYLLKINNYFILGKKEGSLSSLQRFSPRPGINWD